MKRNAAHAVKTAEGPFLGLWSGTLAKGERGLTDARAMIGQYCELQDASASASVQARHIVAAIIVGIAEISNKS